MKALQVDNVTKIYRNGVHALKGVTFTIDKGDFFALLGPNGAGKTTLIGILTSLVLKTSGNVKIFDYDIDTHFSAAKEHIGVVPQEYNFNVFEKVRNIILDQAGYYGIPRKIAKQRADRYLQQLGLWEKRNSIALHLSGGMKRRLMIARALVHEPKMLVLDEPTAGVDVELRRSMWKFLRHVNEQGTTIILTTHYLEEAENNCRRVAIIDHGEIIENTSMTELLQKLDYEHIILYLSAPVDSVPEIQDCKVIMIDNMTLDVEVPRQLGLSSLFDYLKEKNIKVTSMRNKVNRLEELFMHLTSRE